MLWDRHECLPGWKSDVQKKADRVLNAVPAQLCSKRDQLVVMDPYHVIGTQHGQQQTGKTSVHIYEMLEETCLELSEIETVVKHGPQHRVGVAKVVAGIVGCGE